MGLKYLSLTKEVRQHMLEEVDFDVHTGTVYKSSLLTAAGVAMYPDLLRAACLGGSDDSLASSLASVAALREMTSRRRPDGGAPFVPVSRNANQTLAESEFNRYYLRGLCRQVTEDGDGSIVIYGAKPSERPREQLEKKIGRRAKASSLLSDLRKFVFVDTALGLSIGPMSWLSACLPADFKAARPNILFYSGLEAMPGREEVLRPDE